jgi:hypothetical protein
MESAVNVSVTKQIVLLQVAPDGHSP